MLEGNVRYLAIIVVAGIICMLVTLYMQYCDTIADNMQIRQTARVYTLAKEYQIQSTLNNYVFYYYESDGSGTGQKTLKVQTVRKSEDIEFIDSDEAKVVETTTTKCCKLPFSRRLREEWSRKYKFFISKDMKANMKVVRMNINLT